RGADMADPRAGTEKASVSNHVLRESMLLSPINSTFTPGGITREEEARESALSGSEPRDDRLRKDGVQEVDPSYGNGERTNRGHDRPERGLGRCLFDAGLWRLNESDRG